MKVLIKGSEGKNFRIVLPSALVLNRFFAGVLSKALEQNGIAIDRRQTAALLKELSRFRREHRDWKLVEVESADGECVEVKI